jgi:hypothetical protein
VKFSECVDQKTFLTFFGGAGRLSLGVQPPSKLLGDQAGDKTNIKIFGIILDVSILCN